MQKVLKWKIGKRLISQNRPPFIVAEISANHNNSLKRTLKLVDEAKNAGADAVKIQTYSADTMTVNSNKKYFKIKFVIVFRSVKFIFRGIIKYICKHNPTN